MTVKIPREIEFWWLIGLMEGEGSFILPKPSGTGGITQRIQIAMTDEDSIAKATEILSKLLGKRLNYVGKARAKAHWNDCYCVSLAGENARTIMRMVVPYMSARRRIAIWRALNRYHPPKQKLDKDNIVDFLLARKA